MVEGGFGRPHLSSRVVAALAMCLCVSAEMWEEPGLCRDFGFDRSNEGRVLAKEAFRTSFGR